MQTWWLRLFSYHAVALDSVDITHFEHILMSYSFVRGSFFQVLLWMYFKLTSGLDRDFQSSHIRSHKFPTRWRRKSSFIASDLSLCQTASLLLPLCVLCVWDLMFHKLFPFWIKHEKNFSKWGIRKGITAEQVHVLQRQGWEQTRLRKTEAPEMGWLEFLSLTLTHPDRSFIRLFYGQFWLFPFWGQASWEAWKDPKLQN